MLSGTIRCISCDTNGTKNANKVCNECQIESCKEDWPWEEDEEDDLDISDEFDFSLVSTTSDHIVGAVRYTSQTVGHCRGKYYAKETWKLTKNPRELLQADAQGEAKYVMSVAHLQAELELQHPAPPGMSFVTPLSSRGVFNIWGNKNNSNDVVVLNLPMVRGSSWGVIREKILNSEPSEGDEFHVEHYPDCNSWYYQDAGFIGWGNNVVKYAPKEVKKREKDRKRYQKYQDNALKRKYQKCELLVTDLRGLYKWLSTLAFYLYFEQELTINVTGRPARADIISRLLKLRRFITGRRINWHQVGPDLSRASKKVWIRQEIYNKLEKFAPYIPALLKHSDEDHKALGKWFRLELRKKKKQEALELKKAKAQEVSKPQEDQKIIDPEDEDDYEDEDKGDEIPLACPW